MMVIFRDQCGEIRKMVNTQGERGMNKTIGRHKFALPDTLVQAIMQAVHSHNSGGHEEPMDAETFIIAAVIEKLDVLNMSPDTNPRRQKRGKKRSGAEVSDSDADLEVTQE